MEENKEVKNEVKSEVKSEAKSEVKPSSAPTSSEGAARPRSADRDKKPGGATTSGPNRYQNRPSRPPYNNRGPQQGGNRGNYEGGGAGGRRFFYKKKVCKLCVNKTHELHFFKDLSAIKRYVSERGKILPRRMTGTCAKHQRLLAREIKKARVVALIPFESK